MALTAAQVMLIDILTDRLITVSTTLAKASRMTEDEVKTEIEKWDAIRAKEMERVRNH